MPAVVIDETILINVPVQCRKEPTATEVLGIFLLHSLSQNVLASAQNLTNNRLRKTKKTV